MNSKSTEEGLRSILHELDDDRARIKQQEQELTNILRRILRSEFGDEEKTLFSTRENVVATLADPRPKYRQAALYVISMELVIDDEIAQKCLMITESDNDDSVRKAALHIVARFHRNTRNPTILKSISTLKERKDLPESVRDAINDTIQMINTGEPNMRLAEQYLGSEAAESMIRAFRKYR